MLMEGSPPPLEARVTLGNWQDPPFNRWAFSHLRELVPTQRISRGAGPVGPLPDDPRSVDGAEVVRTDGKTGTVGEVLADTFTDAVVVVHEGSVALERFAGETHSDTPHLLMSVSKSLVGSVVGCLAEKGALDPASLVTAYVPELEVSGYSGARVRDLLDMRSGVKFSEDYTDLASEVRLIEQAFGWRPVAAGLETGSMYEYLPTLVADREHGGAFSYRSCETDVLGWVCERAAGERMSELLSELVWAPMGAERDAEVTCDRLGAAIHDGGICATARDLARFGLLLLDGGGAGGRQVIPADWLASSWNLDAEITDAFAKSASAPFMAGGWYRNQFWFVPRPHGPVLLCLGIYGQMVYVNPATRTVAAKLSSWPVAQSAAMLHDTLRAFDTIGATLAGMTLEAAGGEPPHPTGPAGIAAGLSRNRSAGSPDA